MREGPGVAHRPGLREEMLLANSERDRERLGRIADDHETSDVGAAQGRVDGCVGVAGSIQDWAHGGS